MEQNKPKTKFSRRSFLKATGATSAVLGLSGLGFFGYEAGRDPASYTGWKTFEGGDQTFPRHRFTVNEPPYEKVGPTRRVDPRSEIVFSRLPTFVRYWRQDPRIESLPEHLQKYYQEHPEDLELDLENIKVLRPKLMADQEKYGRTFLLAEAWSEAMAAVVPPRITEPPEKADFPYVGWGRGQEKLRRPYKLKSPAKTSRLIKKIAHELGATLVGIARLNPDWVFQYPIPGRGLDPNQPLEIPSHWEYAIVVGTPMSWDPMYANPNYGTSEDAYSISRIIAYRLAAFIKYLGYAARPHTPGYSYDLMVPPIMIDAGLGEQARSSIVITPELGPNFRAAVVTTN
ncbi:MAG TPA: twin-arginine translocation signal domain-containing protein, partial [Candidatus Aminicenantes bacterium]|nr:twin-arginine translocation signal domain-containing protein [Candidatus Aminicenantes bacterium]